MSSLDMVRKRGLSSVSSFWRLFKYFSVACLLSVTLVSIFATLLPKRSHNVRSSNLHLLTEDMNEFIIDRPADIKKYSKKDSENRGRMAEIVTEGELGSRFSRIENVVSLVEIRLAVTDGSYSKLTILRPEILGRDLVKETALLPEVKSILLKKLKVLMTSQDWTNWKEDLKLISRNPTKARIFVDDIRTINFQLGRYLETAALLFSSLYNHSAYGRVFSPQETLYSLIQQSEQLFQNRVPAAISSRVYLDTLITEDVTFENEMEALRAKLIVTYYDREPNEIETHLVLLSTIKSENFTNEITEMYGQVLSHVINKTSPRFREELRVHYLGPDYVKKIVGKSSLISKYISEIYRLGVLDYLNQGQITHAKSNFRQLASFIEDQSLLGELQNNIDKALSDSGTYEKAIDSNKRPVPGIEEKLQQENVRIFSEPRSDHAVTAKKIERYGIYVALVVLLFALILKLKSRLSALWANRTRQVDNSNLKRGAEKAEGADLINELDASIKSGKTVPMNPPPRSRSGLKKAANL